MPYRGTKCNSKRRERTMTQPREPTENHNGALSWPMELRALESELDDHIQQTGSELDMWRLEITQTEFRLKELQGTVGVLEYRLSWLRKCWYTAHKLGLIIERHAEVILKDDPHLFDDFPDSWDQAEGSKDRK